MIAAVVAIDNNYGIGRKGELLTHIPEDMKTFKKITSNGSVIVGRKTYDSLPKKPLPNRTNIVITSKCKKKPKVQGENLIHSNMEYIKAWLSNEDVITKNNGIYVIGGGQIYNELLPFCERVYITKINHAYDNVDTYFPNIDEMPEWEMTSASEVKEYNGIQYQFCVYDRVDYEIYNVLTHKDDESIKENDMVITVKTFNCYKTIIIGRDEGNLDVYIDDWEYLNTNCNMAKFVDNVHKFIDRKEV